MAAHRKRRRIGRGSKSSHRMSRRRSSSIESGGRTSDMETGERS